MAGTPFLEIYKKAITEFQDPHLKSLYTKNVLLFTQVMNNFMVNAISLFTNPLAVRAKLSKRVMPYEFNDTFVGDGVTTKFTLTNVISQDDISETIFSAKVNDVSTPVEYDSLDNSVNFALAPDDGSSIIVTSYYTGTFTLSLFEEEKYILSQWLMVCWSEYVQNNKLDIDRLLGDTDFKLGSNATTTQAKDVWYIVNRETATKRMSKYAWDSSILGLYK